MATQLAHNLNDMKWRSSDIRAGVAALVGVAGVDGQAEEAEEAEESESCVTFGSLNLRPSVLSGLRANGFERLSGIQLHAIPLGRCGLDLILQSKSGTGKTCVFVVIALELLETVESTAIQVLVVCPTREIAVQTSHVMNALGSHAPNIRCCSVIGGTRVREDMGLLSKSRAVVGTPGRLKQLIDLNVLKTNSIRLLVLDECDKLLDKDFKQQIDYLFECLPQNKQTIAVSATMSSELALFLRQYMRSPVFVRLNADNPALIGVKQYYRITESHHLNHINFDNKIEPLIQILKNIPFSQCLVFSNYQTRARMLCDQLNGLLEGVGPLGRPRDPRLVWKTEYISGDKSQTDRLEAISRLRKYKCRVLVSTDLTARGIDVHNINLVVNMDTPFDAQTYLHRIGRAGRFGTRGIAITIASTGRETELLNKIIKDCKLEVEELKDPIPADIWQTLASTSTSDSDSGQHLLRNGDSVSPMHSHQSDHYLSECNPFARKPALNEHNLSDSSNQFSSFSDILNQYNSIKNCSKINGFNVSSNNNNINNNCESNVSNCFESIETENSINLVNNMSEKKFNFELKSGFCDAVQNDKQNELCFDLNNLCLNSNYNSNHNSNERISEKCNNSSVNLIGNGLSQWATALLPPISSVRTPLQYNQWITKNKYFWSYMLNPFERRALESTQNPTPTPTPTPIQTRFYKY